MPFAGLSQDEMRMALNELEQALFHHEQWYEDLHRTLICTQAPDARDTQEDAHRKCRFGQWLYGKGSERIGSRPGFAQIKTTHELMHDYTRKLLQASSAGKPISLDTYEHFSNALKQMRLEILTTKHELEDAIFNLDPLTGASSRIGMLTKLREQQSLVIRKVHFTCIAMMDLDHFKEVNDLYGHTMGDQVLVEIAHRVISGLRPYDSFFRWGGEEFLICTPNTELHQARPIIDRLREQVAAMEFKGEHQKPFNVTVSFGLTLLDPDVPVEESIERADKALYAAKAAGRNQTIVWDASLT
jgi:diguanylate cyclase